MIPRFLVQLLGILLVCAGVVAPIRAAQPPVSTPSFNIAPIPKWVRPQTPDLSPTVESGSGGIYYVLVDQQENLEPRAAYYHEARRIASENGLQNGASISVSFDPSYQKLVFHRLRILRDGKQIDRLVRSQIKLLQREEESESFLYDGTYTADSQLEDVRVGDIVELAYTIEGANPILKGKYFDSFATEWSIPMHQASIRIVFPEARKLNFLSWNRVIQPKLATDRGITEWTWEERDIAARQIDSNIPRGYNPYGMVQISEFADWRQVIDWALPLYQVEGKPSAELEQQITRLRGIENPEERILAGLRFVQDEIRYLGIESGVGSHQPTAPSEVLRRRFGDCKDKTLLLATLLRAAGLAANPALVSTGLRNYVTDRLPSPGVFNHVILQVESGQATYWLDTTRSQQRGSLSQIYIGNYGQALVLRPGGTGLTAFAPSPESMPKKKIVETYRIPTPDAAARLEVVSEFQGLSADLTRSYFRNNTKEAIQKEYLQYYARRFPRIQTAQAPEFKELPDEGGCVVKEWYIIPEIWQLNEEKKLYELVLYPGDLDEEMGTPGSSVRKDPLALSFPTNITHEMHAEMFKPWKLEVSNREVANEFFRFEEVTKVDGAHLTMSGSYQTLRDQVPAADVPRYDAALRKLKDRLGYSFTYRPPQQAPAATTASATSSPSAGQGQFNWPIALLLGVIVAGAIPYSIRFYHFSKLPESLPPSLSDRSLEGLGGWLIPVAIGLFARPVMFLSANFTLYPTIFNLETWQALTMVGQPAYHPYWMPTLLFELIYNSLAAIVSLLLLVLFFKKRAAWPKCFAIFLACMVIGVVFDVFLGKQIPAAATHMEDAARSIFKVTVAAVVWIPYCFVSKRVKATFRH